MKKKSSKIFWKLKFQIKGRSSKNMIRRPEIVQPRQGLVQYIAYSTKTFFFSSKLPLVFWTAEKFLSSVICLVVQIQKKNKGHLIIYLFKNRCIFSRIKNIILLTELNLSNFNFFKTFVLEVYVGKKKMWVITVLFILCYYNN